MSRSAYARSSLVFIAASFLFGCDKEDAPAVEEAEVIATRVDAEMGGTVEADGASLTLPPGALVEDTDVTVEVLASAAVPDAELLAARVYDFGPPGLALELPVDVSVDFDPAKVPAGSKPVLAFLDGDRWIPLPTTSTEGGVAIGKTMLLDPISVVFVASGTAAGACEQEAFDACGGDVRGSWSYAGACLSLPEPPTVEACPGSSFSLGLDVSGTVNFGLDAGYSVHGSQTMSMELVVPKHCLPVESCSSFDDGAVDLGDACKAAHSTTQANVSAGTWSTDGGSIMLDGAAARFCVAGDELTIRFDDDEQTIVYRLTRN